MKKAKEIRDDYWNSKIRTKNYYKLIVLEFLYSIAQSLEKIEKKINK